MTTKLDGALKRELSISGEPYILTIEPQGFKLVPKGKRKGFEMDWSAFVSGDEALATALTASLKDGPIDRPTKTAASQAPSKSATALPLVKRPEYNVRANTKPRRSAGLRFPVRVRRSLCDDLGLSSPVGHKCHEAKTCKHQRVSGGFGDGSNSCCAEDANTKIQIVVGHPGSVAVRFIE